ncbi:hypothetical protein CDL15_Pgr019783 [Punica granatum]|uniref:Uncharacterized protein n=1 Tax=Punica granatum TaxID=22663 RepID=A0A218X6F0_PUNGR|nr:hypothetical protein CDL15_Pgr019783 [Punica granatum]
MQETRAGRWCWGVGPTRSAPWRQRVRTEDRLELQSTPTHSQVEEETVQLRRGERGIWLRDGAHEVGSGEAEGEDGGPVGVTANVDPFLGGGGDGPVEAGE